MHAIQKVEHCTVDCSANENQPHEELVFFALLQFLPSAAVAAAVADKQTTLLNSCPFNCSALKK